MLGLGEVIPPREAMKISDPNALKITQEQGVQIGARLYNRQTELSKARTITNSPSPTSGTFNGFVENPLSKPLTVRTSAPSLRSTSNQRVSRSGSHDSTSSTKSYTSVKSHGSTTMSQSSRAKSPASTGSIIESQSGATPKVIPRKTRRETSIVTEDIVVAAVNEVAAEAAEEATKEATKEATIIAVEGDHQTSTALPTPLTPVPIPEPTPVAKPATVSTSVPTPTGAETVVANTKENKAPVKPLPIVMLQPSYMGNATVAVKWTRLQVPVPTYGPSFMLKSKPSNEFLKRLEMFAVSS
jgi:hypothetical protein